MISCIGKFVFDIDIGCIPIPIATLFMTFIGNKIMSELLRRKSKYSLFKYLSSSLNISEMYSEKTPNYCFLQETNTSICKLTYKFVLKKWWTKIFVFAAHMIFINSMFTISIFYNETLFRNCYVIILTWKISSQIV